MITITELYEWVKENGTQTGTTAWYGEGNDIDYIVVRDLVPGNMLWLLAKICIDTDQNEYDIGDGSSSIKFRVKGEIINVILHNRGEALAWIYATSWMSRHMHTCPKDESHKIKHDRETRVAKFIYFINEYKRGERM